jgi:hypothetical protein
LAIFTHAETEYPQLRLEFPLRLLAFFRRVFGLDGTAKPSATALGIKEILDVEGVLQFARHQQFGSVVEQNQRQPTVERTPSQQVRFCRFDLLVDYANVFHEALDFST